MAPKLIRKYDREFLETLARSSRGELQALAREERDAGAKLGISLNSATPAIITELLKIKIRDTAAVKPSSSEQGTGGAPHDDDEKIADLTKQLEDLKASKAARAAAEADKAKGDAQVAHPTEKVKLVQPSTLSEPVEKPAYRVWRQEVATWLSLYKRQYSGPALLQCLLLSLGTKTKAAAFDQVPEGTLTLDALVAKLDAKHGGNQTLRERQTLNAYRAFKRGNAVSLTDFLVEHDEMRTAAMVIGCLETGPQDSWDLLDAASLSGTQRSGVLDGIAREKRVLERMFELRGEPVPAMPTTYEEMYKSLEVLGFALQHGDQKSSGPTKDAEVLFSQKGQKGDRKGQKDRKGAQSQGSQRETRTCHTCQKVGHLAKDCWQKAKGSKGGQKGAKGKGKGQGKNEGKSGGKADWKCPECQSSVWGSKDKCFKTGCTGTRPDA